MSIEEPSGFLIVHHPADAVHAEWAAMTLEGAGYEVVSNVVEALPGAAPTWRSQLDAHELLLVLVSPEGAALLARAAALPDGLDVSSPRVVLVRVRPGGSVDAGSDRKLIDLEGAVGSRRRRALLEGVQGALGSRSTDRSTETLAGEVLRGGREEDVRLGASAPASAAPGEEFTARFVAYTPGEEAEVEQLLRSLSPRSQSVLGVKRCRWKPDTRVAVRLSGKHLEVDDAEQEFVWTGEQVLLDFDVSVVTGAEAAGTILKFDVSIDGIAVAKLRVDLALGHGAAAGEVALAKGEPARTAFASYSSQDRDRVLDRVAAVRISAGLDVFLDCLSLRPGDQWKGELAREIVERDQFLLFWSSHAGASEWVNWELREALEKKDPDSIQVHPLESVERAPPPPELQHLHFGDPYVLARSDAGSERS